MIDELKARWQALDPTVQKIVIVGLGVGTWLLITGAAKPRDKDGLMHADAPPGPFGLPSDQWDDETKLTMGQALMMEGGNKYDHQAIPHTLARKWLYFRDNGGKYDRFEDFIKAYCQGFPVLHHLITPNSVHVRSTYTTLDSLPDWVKHTLDLFEAGQLPDPTPGAWDWGDKSPAFDRTGQWVEVAPGLTTNRFWRPPTHAEVLSGNFPKYHGQGIG